MRYIVLLLVSVQIMLSSCTQNIENTHFVTVKGDQFYLNGKPYVYAGANYWQGMHLGSEKYGNREQLKRELDQLKSYGITNLRVMAGCEADATSKFCMQPALQTSPGVYDEALFEGLDFLLSEMAKRDMKAVMVLSNFWTWSGGFSQYLKWDGAGEIPYPQMDEFGWWDYGEYTKEFFNSENSLKWYNNHVDKVLGRTNTINGKSYNEDATIMAWQLANEPRGYDNEEPFQRWIKSTAAKLKFLAPNHLVSLGSEGNTPSEKEGLIAERDNAYADIDYITMHIWVQNWNWFTPGEGEDAYAKMITQFDAYWNDHVAVSAKLNKPIVLEEYGLARDEFSYDIDAPVTDRDKYYSYVFNNMVSNINKKGSIKGINFWGYSGEARPPRPGEYWNEGDAFVADPPHELQGWYGVYNTDLSTLQLIKDQMSKL